MRFEISDFRFRAPPDACPPSPKIDFVPPPMVIFRAPENLRNEVRAPVFVPLFLPFFRAPISPPWYLRENARKSLFFRAPVFVPLF